MKQQIEALRVLKLLTDRAIEKGILTNIEEAASIIQALKVLSDDISARTDTASSNSANNNSNS